MKDVVAKSGILVLASHSLDLLEEWCTRAVWLDLGHVKMMGPVKDVVAAYRAATTGAA